MRVDLYYSITENFSMYVILREKVNNVKERQGMVRNYNEVSSIPKRETALQFI